MSQNYDSDATEDAVEWFELNMEFLKSKISIRDMSNMLKRLYKPEEVDKLLEELSKK